MSEPDKAPAADDAADAAKQAALKKAAAAKAAKAAAERKAAEAEAKPEVPEPEDVFEAAKWRADKLANDKKAKAWPFPARHRVPTVTEDLERLVERFGKQVVAIGDVAGKPCVYVKPAVWFEASRLARDELGFDHCAFVSAADYDKEDVLEAHAQLYSYDRRADLALKTHLPREGATLPSLVPLWSGCDWHERETYDMFGIRFEGHPNPTRIFMPEGWRGHPLLKDYDESEQFIGLGPDGDDVVYDTPGPDRW